MSDRLISADKAKEVLKHLLYETAMNNELDIADIYEDIIENRLDTWIELIPTVDAEVKEIEYVECSNALLKMWMDKVVTDNEYYRIAERLNRYWGKREKDAESN